MDPVQGIQTSHQITNPNVTRNAGPIGSIGHTILAIPLAAFSLLVNMIRGIGRSILVGTDTENSLKAKITQLEGKIKEFPPLSPGEINIQMDNLRKEIDKINLRLTEVEELNAGRSRDLKMFFVSLASLVPFLGIALVGDYFQGQAGVKDVGVRAGTEALIQSLFDGIDSVAQTMFFPRSQSSSDQTNKDSLDYQITVLQNAGQIIKDFQACKADIQRLKQDKKTAKSKNAQDAIDKLLDQKYKTLNTLLEKKLIIYQSKLGELKKSNTDQDQLWISTLSRQKARDVEFATLPKRDVPISGLEQEYDEELGKCAPLDTPERIATKKKELHLLINEELYALGAVEVEIPVDRAPGKVGKLQALEIPPKGKQKFDPTLPTICVFHANMETLFDMKEKARFYQNCGVNVLLVTMGGYPGSDPGTTTSEATTCQDANAVVKYLKNRGCQSAGFHGTSIGGHLAFTAAELDPAFCKIVIADQTFDCAKNVAANLVHNCAWSDYSHVTSQAPTSLVRGVVGAAFPPGKAIYGVTKDNKPYVTNGMDNGKKCAALPPTVDVVAIKATRDRMMGRNPVFENGQWVRFNTDSADDLLRQRYPSSRDNCVELSGGHCSYFGDKDIEDPTIGPGKLIHDRLRKAFNMPQ